MLQPKLLSKIWAALGLKNSIPDSRSDGLAQGAATYDEGFPSITMTPIAQGGKAPSGKDMNGVLSELSAHIVHLNKGGLYKFDVTFAGKINGYDKGAVLLNDAETALFVSLVSQNKHNFNTSLDYSKYWAKLADVQSVKHITPLKLTSQTQNTLLPNGHTHEIEKASLTEVGITKLFSGLDSDAEDMAATPKVIKILKGLIDAITRNLGNYIPNSKKSNAVDSNSADTVATSYAVKTAYDLADAAYKVDTNNQNQNLNNLLGQNTVFGTSGRAAGTTGLGDIYNYGVGLAMSASGAMAILYVPHSTDSRNSGVWVQSSFAGNGAASRWRRIDGADFADIRDNPLSLNGTILQCAVRYIGVDADNGAYGGLQVNRNDSHGNWMSRLEALPDRRWKFWNNSDSRGFEQYLPAKSGTIALMDDVNARVSKSGDTMTGNLNIKNGDYTAVRTYNTEGWSARWESAPQSANHFAAIVQANNNESVVNRVLIPKKNGTVLLDSDSSILGDANTYVKRDVAGDIFARLLRSTYQNESRMVGAIAFRVNNGNDNFTRYCDSPEAVRNWLEVNVKNIVVLQGVINHGGTIPLPSGFNEAQCRFFVSTNNSNPNDTTWDWNESTNGKHYRNICRCNGRVVTCQTIVNDGISGHGAVQTVINGTANYIVIGVK